MKSKKDNKQDAVDNDKNIARNTKYGNGESHPVFYLMVLVVVVAALIYYYFNPIDPK